MSVAVLILTLNEERHIERAIACVKPFAADIVVVDAGSHDRTVALAEGAGARVFSHPWVNYAQQFQWGMDQTGISADWILRLDADEVIEADLAGRISRDVTLLPPVVTGVTLDRKHIFMGRWIRHGGRYPLRLLRLVRRGQGRIEQRWMDEHLLVNHGTVVHFPGGFADHNLNDLGYFIDKHNRYATREAVDVLNQRHGLFARDAGVAAQSQSQASWRRSVKERVYNRLPFPLTALSYFLFRYLIQLGFLDGREGLVYHFLQGFWYRFLVGAKITEFERQLTPLGSAAEKRARLRQLTGLDL